MNCINKDGYDICTLHGGDYEKQTCPYVGRCDCANDDPTVDDITAMIFEISQMIGDIRTEIKTLRTEVRKATKPAPSSDKEAKI